MPKIIKKWLNSSLRLKGVLEIIPVHGEVPLDIFQVIQNDYLQFQFSIRRYNFNIRKKQEDNIDFKNILSESKRIISSISRFLRKQFNEKDILTLHTITRGHPNHSTLNLSPKAYTYILWKMYINMDNDLRNIDNGTVKYPTTGDYPRVFAQRYNSKLTQIYYILNSINISNKDMHKLLISLFSHMLIFDYKRIEHFLYNEEINTKYLINVDVINFLKEREVFLGIVIDLRVNQVLLIEDLKLFHLPNN